MAVHEGHVCAGLQDGSIRIWRLDGTEAGALVGHREIVGALTSAGRWLMSGCNDSDVRVWDVAAGLCVAKLGGHTKRVVSLAASGARVASGSWDFTVRVWREAQVVRLGRAGSDEPVRQHDSNIHWQPATRWSGAVPLPPQVAREQGSGGNLLAISSHDKNLVQVRPGHRAAAWGCERVLCAGERVYCVAACAGLRFLDIFDKLLTPDGQALRPEAERGAEPVAHPLPLGVFVLC